MAKKKTTEVNNEVLTAVPVEETFVPVEEVEPIDDNFQVRQNINVVGAINTILANVQTLIHYLEYANSKGIFSFKDGADIFNSINEINAVTDSLEN